MLEVCNSGVEPLMTFSFPCNISHTNCSYIHLHPHPHGLHMQFVFKDISIILIPWLKNKRKATLPRQKSYGEILQKSTILQLNLVNTSAKTLLQKTDLHEGPAFYHQKLGKAVSDGLTIMIQNSGRFPAPQLFCLRITVRKSQIKMSNGFQR